MALTVAFVVVNLRPQLWFVDTTPTGGDLGAHVWGPAYLRDVLLPQMRLTGWTHDWYAGFPAFAFYMVVPSLLVVAVDAGVASAAVFAWLAVAGAAGAGALVVLRRTGRPSNQCWMAVLAVVAAAGAVKLMFADVEADRALAALGWPAAAGWWTWYATKSKPRVRLPAVGAAVVGALLLAPMPYGVALKLVAIAGVVALPVAVAAMARLGGVGAEGQALAAVATLVFLFDRSFNIYGGNLMSTMAGEFAYSLGLAAAVCYIGVAARGMRSGQDRLLAGGLLALTGLMHLFSAFFALAATAALLLAMPWRGRAWRRRLVWTVSSGALAAALAAWWVLPFWWNRGLLNDMGWGKERRYLSSLWSRSSFDYSFLANDPPLQLFVVLALCGAVLLFWQRSRLGMALALTGAVVAAGFVVLPEGRLWNVRILPFYYLTVYLTAALGLGEAIRLGRSALDLRISAHAEARADAGGDARAEFGGEVDGDARAEARSEAGGQARGEVGTQASSEGTVEAGGEVGRMRRWAPPLVSGGCVAVLAVAVAVTVGLPLRSLPGGTLGDDGVYRWGPFSASESNLGPYWVQYNFEGYEGRSPTADGGGSDEYWDLVDTMELIGERRGCGPALWEYEAGRLGSYGTPMAPMLLPFWTDRCIASMEGLYFEASATTPYHFLMQSELSSAPSRAQRDLPYSGLDVVRGVEHMRLMGVRYYMAFSPDAVRQARSVPGLTEVGTTSLGPWIVFEVAGHAGAVGLDRLPVVVEGLDDSDEEWLEAAVGAFGAGPDRPTLAADGPESWPRMSLPDVGAASRDEGGREEVMRRLSGVLATAAPVVGVEAAEVTEMVRDDHSISFSVDRVGSPVLVRTSYFPNWSASGAEGPWRVTPNLMVVVPTDTEVRLDYGRSGVEWFAAAVTLFALVAVGWLWRRAARTSPDGAAGAEHAPREATGGPGASEQAARNAAPVSTGAVEQASPEVAPSAAGVDEQAGERQGL